MGRPKIKGGRRQPVSVLLRPKVRKAATTAAASAEKSLSAWIAMLVEDHFLTEARERVG